MNLKRLLTIHAVITLAAGMVLIFAPAIIPASVNIEIHQGQNLLCYFLASAELALAYLSYYGRTINEPATIKLITITIIIFHFATLVLELLALSDGLSPSIIANVVARVIIIGLFYYYGILKQKISI